MSVRTLVQSIPKHFTTLCDDVGDSKRMYSMESTWRRACDFHSKWFLDAFIVVVVLRFEFDSDTAENSFSVDHFMCSICVCCVRQSWFCRADEPKNENRTYKKKKKCRKIRNSRVSVRLQITGPKWKRNEEKTEFNVARSFDTTHFYRLFIDRQFYIYFVSTDRRFNGNRAQWFWWLNTNFSSSFCSIENTQFNFNWCPVLISFAKCELENPLKHLLFFCQWQFLCYFESFVCFVIFVCSFLLNFYSRQHFFSRSARFCLHFRMLQQYNSHAMNWIQIAKSCDGNTANCFSHTGNLR